MHTYQLDAELRTVARYNVQAKDLSEAKRLLHDYIENYVDLAEVTPVAEVELVDADAFTSTIIKTDMLEDEEDY